MKRDIPDIVIEQLLLDELDPRRTEELLRDPEVLERLEALKASNAQILADYPVEAMAVRIEERLRVVVEAEERVNGSRAADSRKAARETSASGGAVRGKVVRLVQWKGFVPALAAAAVIALVIGVAPLLIRGGMSPSEDSGFRVKGVGPVLHVYRETANGVERLANGSHAGVHDLLQLSYIAAGARFGMIFSVDGSGTVTLHFPARSPYAAPLQTDGEVALPYSYELDNAPRFERFYLVTSQTEFSVNQILEVARRAATSGRLSTGSFPPGFHVAVFTVNKETKR